jgi:hypothetical protein
MIAIGFALICPAPSQAQPSLQPPGGGSGPGPSQPASGEAIVRIKPAMTAELLKQAKYEDVRVLEPRDNVQSVVGKMGGVPVYVHHFLCEDEGCRLLSFTVYFGQQSHIDANYINAWHYAWRFVKLYRDKKDNLIFKWDVHLFSGVPPNYIRDAASMYAHMLKKLLEFKPEDSK